MGSRRQAREMALQMLCTMERQPELSADQAATLFFKYQAYSNQEDEGEASATPQVAVPTLNEDRIFSEQLVRGVSNYQSEIDGLLSRCSRNWRLERMSWVDRNLLRLASFELLRCPQTSATRLASARPKQPDPSSRRSMARGRAVPAMPTARSPMG